VAVGSPIAVFGLNRERQRLAEKSEELRRNLVAGDMNLAQQALAVNNLGRARELLNRHRPAPGQTDLRGWEWRYLWQQCRSVPSSPLREPDAIASRAHQRGQMADHRLGRQRRFDIWDLETRREVARPAPEEVPMRCFLSKEPLLALRS
jgi:hypothetical protein